MADVFISYKREDRRVAERLSIALEQLGFDVWWDFELMSGDRFRRVIEKVIDECKATIVLWSDLARDSEFVIDEATYASAQNKLCPARIDDCRIPLGFGGMHADDLREWNGEMGHAGLQALLRGLEAKTGKQARLGSKARGETEEAKFAELEAFKAAQIAGSPQALRSFLRQYPKGAFSNFVRGQVEIMPAENASMHAGSSTPSYPPRPPPAQQRLQAHPEPSTSDNRGATPDTPPSRPPWALIGVGVIAALALIFAVLPRGGETPPLPDSVIETQATTTTDQQGGLTSATTSPTATYAPFDLNQLDPNVRAAVINARAAETRANAYAVRARSGGTDGVGVSTGATGNHYEGQVGATGATVEGMITMPDGVTYTGQFESGDPTHYNGYGVYRFANGFKYEGQWSSDQYSGYGVYWDAEGHVHSAGVWSNSALMTSLTR